MRTRGTAGTGRAALGLASLLLLVAVPTAEAGIVTENLPALPAEMASAVQFGAALLGGALGVASDPARRPRGDLDWNPQVTLGRHGGAPGSHRTRPQRRPLA